MKVARAELSRFEPTVFGAIRRYRVMVAVVVIAAVAAALGYAVLQGRSYRAQSSVSVPLPASQQPQNAPQYLDSQVLLMQSQGVAQQAARIANGTLHRSVLTPGSFLGPGSSLTITPPSGAASGTYGASIVQVAFVSSSARTAQAGANAFIQAFADVRSEAIVAQANTAIAGIDRAISSAGGQGQQATLLNQRTQEIINEKVDLAAQPTAASAIEPAAPAGGSRSQRAVIGLVAGIVLGAVLAYARASRRRGFRGQQDPAALYGVPLIGEIPASAAGSGRWPGRKPAPGMPLMTTSSGSRAAEAFRFAAGSVERIRAEQGPNLSLAFVSPLTGGGRSMVVANLALAVADGGTRVLVVDADGGLAGWLRPQDPGSGGLEQVLAGQRVLQECAQPSPLNAAVTVLGPGPSPASEPVTGAARARAARFLLTEAKERYDLVLIDSPALLEVADAAELAAASDAVVIVVSASDLIRDHLALARRLEQTGCDAVGYIYDHTAWPRGGRSPGARSVPHPGEAPPAADAEGQRIAAARRPSPQRLPQG